jgi:anti-anti-sigma regulatory factor
MITGAYRVARAEGGNLALVRPVGSVARVLNLMGVSRVITVYDSVDDAITAAREGL